MRVTVECGTDIISRQVDAITAWKILQLLGFIEKEVVDIGLLEQKIIRDALAEKDFDNYQQLADDLGMSNKTLWMKRKRFKLDPVEEELKGKKR